MLELKGKDLKQQVKQESENYGITTEGNKIFYRYKTSYGDEVKMVFTSGKREIYAAFAEKAWTTQIEDYTLLENGIIYLPPALYWNLYKRITNGKEFLQGTGSKLYINEKQYSFPDTAFYFTPQEDAYVKGVYAICHQDKLLYIGSASDVKARWKEHDACFRDRVENKNPMYSVGYNADELVYKVIEDQESLGAIIGEEHVSMWVFELMEYVYIKALSPIYNREGYISRFSFKAKPGDLPINYQKIFQSYMLSSVYDSLFEHEDLLKEDS